MRYRRWLLCVCVLAFPGCRPHADAQTATPKITFEYDFPGETPPHFSIDLSEDGSGRYQAPGGSEVVASDMPFRLPASVAGDWFAEARALKYFNGNFEAKRKVAFSGHKTLRYTGPDGSGETTLNYSEDKRMTELIAHFQAIGFTLQSGQRFESDARFHRMGLDADMVTYKEGLKNHQAIHPEIIAPILQQLVDDPDIMTRVQRDASEILRASPANQ